MDTSFHLGFGIAAVGMFIGLVAFCNDKKEKSWTCRHLCGKPSITNEKKKVYTHIGIGFHYCGLTRCDCHSNWSINI